MAVLRARQARNCVPKPFHYFELVLLTPLRQPKLGPLRLSPVARVEHEETVRILRRPSILRLCELGSPRRPRSGSGRGAARAAGPSPPRGRRTPTPTASSCCPPPSIWSWISSRTQPLAQEEKRHGAGCGQQRRSGQAPERGTGEGEGEYGVGEIVNKRVAKDSGSKTRTDLVPRKGPASSPTPIWSRRTWKAAPSTSARARAR